MNVAKDSQPNWFKECVETGFRFFSFHIENRRVGLSVQIQMEVGKREYEQNGGSYVTPDFSHTSPSFDNHELSCLYKPRMFCFQDLGR